jgi:hypothetical protein
MARGMRLMLDNPDLRAIPTVAAFFAETDPGTYRRPDAVVSEYAGAGLPVTALSGSADEHLDAICRRGSQCQLAAELPTTLRRQPSSAPCSRQ